MHLMDRLGHLGTGNEGFAVETVYEIRCLLVSRKESVATGQLATCNLQQQQQQALIISNLKCIQKVQTQKGDASVSNYFHILWRKFSWAPKPFFNRNETKLQYNEKKSAAPTKGQQQQQKRQQQQQQQILKRHQDYCTEKFFSSHLCQKRLGS